MDMIYRKLIPSEIIQYRQIRLESLQIAPDAFGASYTEEAANPKLRFETFIEQELPDKFMTGAFDGAQLVGICGLIREEQQKSHHRGIIIQMFVKPQLCHRGIGSALLKQTLDIAFELPGLEMITLGVVPDNMAAVKLYERCGFIKYGSLSNYLKTNSGYCGQDFMVLSKSDYFKRIKI